jgi:hypothetical protein
VAVEKLHQGVEGLYEGAGFRTSVARGRQLLGQVAQADVVVDQPVDAGVREALSCQGKSRGSV